MKNRGFTLIEILITVGILVALLAIALPVLVIAQQSSKRAGMAADLQSVTPALDAYKLVHGSYQLVYDDLALGNNPLIAAPPSGAEILCRALISPGPAVGTGQDGADGSAFRIRAGGKIYPAYLSPDKF